MSGELTLALRFNDNARVDELYREFGARLRTARRRANFTQAQLAQRVGLTRTSITNIESGGQRIQLHVVYDLAAAVGTQPIDLLPAPPTGRKPLTVPERLLRGLRPADLEWVESVISSTSEEGHAQQT